jgi:hypothetical protein
MDSRPTTFLDEQGRYLDTQGRPEPPIAGDEAATLVGFLERQRATFAWKCGGLDANGLRARYILVNMIEEYAHARHNGQADLIRESIDGLVGLDPPE